MKKITTGIVLEILSKNEYLIQTEQYGTVKCKLAGKAKSYLQFDIRLGEEVQIEISPTDNSRARVEPRGWKRKL